MEKSAQNHGDFMISGTVWIGLHRSIGFSTDLFLYNETKFSHNGEKFTYSNSRIESEGLSNRWKILSSFCLFFYWKGGKKKQLLHSRQSRVDMKFIKSISILVIDACKEFRHLLSNIRDIGTSSQVHCHRLIASTQPKFSNIVYPKSYCDDVNVRVRTRRYTIFPPKLSSEDLNILLYLFRK